MTWNVLDLFSGIGGFSLGLERAGMTAVAFCEIDPFCRKVLAKHWPGVPIYEDIRELSDERLKAIAPDIITGGFPCQDVSLAGKRAGLAGENSGLYRELVRALCVVRPRHGIVENVAALLSDGMGTVLGDLAEGGIDAEWDCVPALAVGAPHERDRVWIVTHADNGYGDPDKALCSGRDTAGLCVEARGTPDAADPDSERRGEARGLRHRSDEMPTGRTEARLAAHAADAEHHGHDGTAFTGGFGASEEKGWLRGEPKGRVVPPPNAGRGGCGANQQDIQQGQPDIARRAGSDPQGERCGQGRAWRPPDSFARVRDEARRNAADPHGARVRFADNNGEIWPDEPALSGVDDDVPDWLDRTRSTGNTVIPYIPELIGLAVMESCPQKETRRRSGPGG